MMTYYIPSFDAICDFPVLRHCYEVVSHEKMLQKDPHVMAVRAQRYWAFESAEPLNLESICAFIANPSLTQTRIDAAFDASVNKMYGSPSIYFVRFPHYAYPAYVPVDPNTPSIEEID
jgi:exosortase/archaeosortase